MLPDSPQPSEPAADTAGAGTSIASAATGTAAAFLPHVLHHAGLIAGAAVLSGVAGGVVFALVGLVAIVPLALHRRRRTGTWRAPIAAVAVFVLMFAVMTAFTRSM